MFVWEISFSTFTNRNFFFVSLHHVVHQQVVQLVVLILLALTTTILVSKECLNSTTTTSPRNVACFKQFLFKSKVWMLSSHDEKYDEANGDRDANSDGVNGQNNIVNAAVQLEV